MVRRNTIAFNTGAATELDVGGGICLYRTYQDVLIERNILFRNEGAVRSYGSARGTVRRNVIFENSPTDFRTSETSDIVFDENLFTDPLFCLSTLGSRGELSRSSPALHSPFGVIGAVEIGSCGPEVRADGLPATWSRLEARYR